MPGRKRTMGAATALGRPVLSAALLLFLAYPSRNVRCSAFVPTEVPLQTAALTRTRPTDSCSVDLNLFGPRNVENGAVGHINGSALKVKGHSNVKTIPFVIERLHMHPRDEVFKNIAEMCIGVFFNEGKMGRALSPWKEVQLSYLRTIQMADLRRRRAKDVTTNAMFVAYRVEEASPHAARSQPLILNWKDIHNSHVLPGTDASMTDYVRTEIVGFCEVSMVPFGLVPNSVRGPALEHEYVYDDDNSNSERLVSKRARKADTFSRPVLTNLSVKIEARTSGVGSKLLEACERTAAIDWGKYEMVLEVEDDNQAARRWYQKRGYRVLFSDPSCRRYDVSGLYLKKVSCTRQVMRKPLNARNPTSLVEANDQSILSFETLGGVLRRLRENVMQTVG